MRFMNARVFAFFCKFFWIWKPPGCRLSLWAYFPNYNFLDTKATTSTMDDKEIQKNLDKIKAAKRECVQVIHDRINIIYIQFFMSTFGFAALSLGLFGVLNFHPPPCRSGILLNPSTTDHIIHSFLPPTSRAVSSMCILHCRYVWDAGPSTAQNEATIATSKYFGCSFCFAVGSWFELKGNRREPLGGWRCTCLVCSHTSLANPKQQCSWIDSCDLSINSFTCTPPLCMCAPSVSCRVDDALSIPSYTSCLSTRRCYSLIY